ncbi:hypothetical protein VTN96DRAFT_9448 [Rasamsonia emersonii]
MHIPSNSLEAGHIHSFCRFLTCKQAWDKSPDSVRSLALVNSTIYVDAVPYIYRTIRIKVTGRKQLREELRGIALRERRRQCFIYTRRLEIDGYMPTIHQERHGEFSGRRVRIILDGDGEDVGDLEDEDDGQEYDELEPVYSNLLDRDDPEDAPVDVDFAWQPLANALALFSRLTDFVFSCDNRFPPILLEALHEHHPQCRLDVRNFWVRNPRGPEVHPLDRELFSSPCLHAIGLRYVPTSRQPDNDVDYDAVVTSMLTSLAPKLKIVRMLPCLTMSGPTVRANWTGFDTAGGLFGIGELTSLSMGGIYEGGRIWQTTGREMLRAWKEYTDFSNLRSLTLQATSLTLLDTMSNLNTLPALERLAIYPTSGDDSDFFQTVILTFLEGLKPLSCLRLRFPVAAQLRQSIFDLHGPTLVDLALEPMTLGELLILREACPRLERLETTIKRSESDRWETRCYEALGRLPCLTKLLLRLDCSIPVTPVPANNGNQPGGPNVIVRDVDRMEFPPDPRLRIGQIQSIMTNSAVDGTLVRQIWDVIAEHKAGKPLQYLKIMNRPGEKYMGRRINGIGKCMRDMKRTYVVQRVLREGQESITVRELGQQRRDERVALDRYQEMELFAEVWPSGPPADLEMLRVFRRIWGPMPGSVDWRDDWRSKPLQREAEPFLWNLLGAS